jgi:hypothetical protein
MYGVSSDHTPIIATVSTEPVNKKPQRLHNRRINWDYYGIIIEEAVNLNISLKSPDPDHLHEHSSSSSSTSHSNSKTTNQMY